MISSNNAKSKIFNCLIIISLTLYSFCLDRIGITAILNMEEPGEHAFCGDDLDISGFSYNPRVFMDNNSTNLFLRFLPIWYSFTFEGAHITARYRKCVLKVWKGNWGFEGIEGFEGMWGYWRFWGFLRVLRVLIVNLFT